MDGFRRSPFVVVVISGWLALVAPQVPVGARVVDDRYTFRTLAGLSGGAADGNGGNARFFFPQDIVVGADGALFVADDYNHAIRRISPNGDVTTFAGSLREPGGADGNGGNARFNQPFALAIDRSGNLYVADAANHTIRRVSPSGAVNTIAGAAGQRGAVDGAGNAARFNNPTGVAVDSSGNVYVADRNNYTIRKITASGSVSTLAGVAGSAGSADGGGSTARFSSPKKLAIDAAGTLYVSDGGTTIRRIVGDVVTTLAGSPGNAGSTNGTGSAARFDGAQAMAINSSGDLYVADYGNHTIRKVTRDGVVTTYAGRVDLPGSTDGASASARFAYPNGIGIDGSGNVYVGDTNNHSIRKIGVDGTVSTIAGSSSYGAANGAGAAARFSQPWGIVVDRSGNAYVSDYYNHAIRKITPDGSVTPFAGSIGTAGATDGSGGVARFRYPRQMAIDAAGNIYVADSNNHTIRKITSAGEVSTLAGSAGAIGNADGSGSAARFNFPSGVAVDTSGNVYVADGSNHTIRQITSTGTVTTIAGQAGETGSADGGGTVARFNFPYAIAVASNRSLYVADASNHTIRSISAAGVVTTLAGGAGSPGSADGTGAEARFNLPAGLAVDAAGNVYVADGDNHVVRRVTSAGVVTTIAGQPGQIYAVDGVASQARFYSPWGVAIDGAGTLYVTERYGNTIRVGTPQ